MKFFKNEFLFLQIMPICPTVIIPISSFKLAIIKLREGIYQEIGQIQSHNASYQNSSQIN
ncbi:MAG: hypothetical protein OXC37_02145 [Bdellovibrionaceae bacterium]|nr:hypothetical protein [Pseudobdellovibrionaceae bacterium]